MVDLVNHISITAHNTLNNIAYHPFQVNLSKKGARAPNKSKQSKCRIES
jgi:hypothetical protein